MNKETEKLEQESIQLEQRFLSLVKTKLKEKGLIQEDLAPVLRVSRGQVGHYLSGNSSMSLQKFIVLTKFLDIQNEKIVTKALANMHDVIKITGETPILTMQEAHTWREIMHTVKQEPDRQKIGITDIDNPYCYGLIVENDVMAPEFKKGDQLLIDPDRVPTSNSFVIVRLLKTGENILRQYVMDGGKIHLIPLNPLYEKITVLPDEIMICGVVASKKYP
jgi:SOS-response transcriptional repressor LexA